ncbi:MULTISPECIES: FUSC family protein [Amycolatopsis]|uniref:FUSC family protein n=1 Tax=Amycolatopsis tucumanensis TaxID=401106 RepID=A0ABP7HXP9_9PSEU|nr:FUSC family protein [Amycolatopsis tucumanensis]MCF6424845.1 FUSC family protein [Amycolatopsis tucumanensis]
MNDFGRHDLFRALSPRGWWRLRPVDRALVSALRAMTGANIVLVAVVIAGHTELAPAAAFGGMTAVHARFEPYPVRARLLAVIGAGLTLAVGLGGAASAAGWGPLPIAILVAAVAAVAKLVTDGIRSGPPGGLMFVFAAGTTSAFPVSWPGVAAQVGAAAAGALVAWVVALSGWLFFDHDGDRTTSWRAGLRAAVDRSSHEWPRAVKVFAAVLAAGLLAHALGLGHPYWATVAAAAVLQATHLQHTMHRFVQRVTGTVAGVLVAALLLTLDLPQPVKLAVIVVALLGAELTVIRNYALAMVFVTPLVLLLGSMSAPVDTVAVTADRLVDTVLGAAIGLAAALVRPGRGYQLA